ncbi:insulinase family protein [Pedobacter frigiditerrae]|uniref:Insulinase family protein n=1 Tax=Pedobacter frigiditerrae TaxID=2530452 RepID=A0A4R0N2M5_9SPHI|nr:M16 family metallopeptidase [Pedobacter frigiditerrae]TCC94010.1 insulinase family protein [Pedobacter frigiditerrae]
MKKYYLIYALASGLFIQPVLAQQKKTTVKAPIAKATTKPIVGKIIPNDPNVIIGKLPNGLTYYIRKNTEPNKRAELYLANKIGSLMENEEQQGLAHFTEHMAFNGTKDFPKNEMINYLQKAGVRFGADLNAYTGFNQTVYQLPIPTDSVEVFKTGFKILANWAGKVTMDGKEIDNERGVIVEEDRQRGKNAQQRMSNQLLPFLLANSQYAKRIPIGKVEILNSFTHDKIRSFYADWYRPNLQSVIAVGDFDVKEVENLIKQNFSDLKNPASPKTRINYDLPDNAQPLVKIATDKEQPYNVAQVIYKQREGSVKTDSDYKKSLIQSMINNMLAGRIQELTQKGGAPFLFAQSTYGSYQGGLVWGISALTTIAVSPTTAGLDKALKAALAENERMAKFGFTAGEFETVKKKIEAGMEKQYKEKDKTKSAVYVQQYLENFLTGSSIPSADYRYAETKKILTTLTLTEVNALAKTLVTKNNQIIVVQAPEKDAKDLPTEAQLIAAIKTAGNGVTPYVDNTVNKPLIAQMPTAGKIVSETKNDKVGITTLVLNNGIKVILKPTDFKNDQVIFTSFGKGGSSLASNDDFQSAENANLVAQSGVGDFNPTQLTKYLAGKTANASAYIDSEYQGFSGSSSPKDLETAFQLIYARATNPRKDVDIFNKNISDFKVITANKNSSPTSVYADTVQAVMANYHKRGMPTTLQDIDKISLDKAYAFYKERFADASGQTFVFVGNFEVEKLKPFITTYLASLPALNKNENFVDNGINPPKGKVSKTVYKGLEDKATVQLMFHDDYVYNADNNIQLDALKAALEIKILERLREKESGVYSPGVDLSVQKYPSAHYYFTISFNCSKANVDKLINAALEEVNSFKVNGATADDLKKFKSEEARQEELSLRDNGFWLGYLSNRLKYGDNVEQLLGDKQRLDAVDVASTKAAAQKYLNGDNYIRLVLVPEK